MQTTSCRFALPTLGKGIHLIYKFNISNVSRFKTGNLVKIFNLSFNIYIYIFFCKNTIFSMRNGKFSIFIEQKLNEISRKWSQKYIEIRENFEQKWTFVHFREFRYENFDGNLNWVFANNSDILILIFLQFNVRYL